jgi:hypothetical protein
VLEQYRPIDVCRRQFNQVPVVREKDHLGLG